MEIDGRQYTVPFKDLKLCRWKSWRKGIINPSKESFELLKVTTVAKRKQ